MGLGRCTFFSHLRNCRICWVLLVKELVLLVQERFFGCEYKIFSALSSLHFGAVDTHPWGVPMLSVMVLKLVLLIWTIWGLLIRKSKIQLQVGVLSPSRYILQKLVRNEGIEC